MTVIDDDRTDETQRLMRRLGTGAREAAATLATVPTAVKNLALSAMATALRDRATEILAANAADVTEGEEARLTPSLVDRLRLDTGRVEAMAAGLEAIAELPDPIGGVMASWTRPNGLAIERVRVPLGVIGIIYESRPNVTADAGGLCLKSGNAAILRGGSESFRSSTVIAACLVDGLAAAGLPEAAIQLVPTRDRAAVGAMLAMADMIDVIVPRGGRSLIERVAAESRVPVFKHLDGICHVYVDRTADPAIARAVTLNSKMRRTSVCGAAETLLVDRAAADDTTAAVLADLIAAGCEIRGDDDIRALDGRVLAATEADWSTEYLGPVLSVRRVDGVDAAIAHINRYGSSHTETIIAEDADAVGRFFAQVDSAILLHNASTQFADGGEFGMGAEIGISTGKLHARGPVGAEQLTSFKYQVRGNGQVRP